MLQFNNGNVADLMRNASNDLQAMTGGIYTLGKNRALDQTELAKQAYNAAKKEETKQDAAAKKEESRRINKSTNLVLFPNATEKVYQEIGSGMTQKQINDVLETVDLSKMGLDGAPKAPAYKDQYDKGTAHIDGKNWNGYYKVDPNTGKTQFIPIAPSYEGPVATKGTNTKPSNRLVRVSPGVLSMDLQKAGKLSRDKEGNLVAYEQDIAQFSSLGNRM